MKRFTVYFAAFAVCFLVGIAIIGSQAVPVQAGSIPTEPCNWDCQKIVCKSEPDCGYETAHWRCYNDLRACMGGCCPWYDCGCRFVGCGGDCVIP